MRYKLLYIVLLLLLNCTCKTKQANTNTDLSSKELASFTKHVIKKGSHYSTKSGYRRVNTSEMKFIVRFDSTAIYQSAIPENQHDLNKLYGFSDNKKRHHVSSARIGWRWLDSALSLHAYVYNNSKWTAKEITKVPLNQDITCSIKVDGNQYIFTVNGQQVSMPRTATTSKAVGYKLYPYFGGNEEAPHKINIYIKDL